MGHKITHNGSSVRDMSASTGTADQRITSPRRAAFGHRLITERDQLTFWLRPADYESYKSNGCDARYALNKRSVSNAGSVGAACPEALQAFLG